MLPPENISALHLNGGTTVLKSTATCSLAYLGHVQRIYEEVITCYKQPVLALSIRYVCARSFTGLSLLTEHLHGDYLTLGQSANARSL